MKKKISNQISDSKKFNHQQKKKKYNANSTKANRISDSKKFNQKKKKSVQEKSIAEMEIVAHSQGSILCLDELIMEILSWMPVRSLFRFKCVAKSWDITLADPYFRMKHQRHHANSTKFLLLHCNFNKTRSFHNWYSTSSLSSPDDVQKLDDLPPNNDPYVLFGSCDGLVLIGVVSRSNDQLLLWNPSTRESILLPPPKFGIKNSTFGLGYDQTTRDYVVLTIHDDMTKIPVDPHCQILALKSGGSWRKVCMKTPKLFCPCRVNFGRFMDPLAFVHGAFHWIACSFCVVSFNISNEAHREIPFPEPIYNYPTSLIVKECGVSVLEGMLCVSSTWSMIGGEDTFMLWAMKDDGINESWTQLFKINFTRLKSAKPIYRFADGDVLFDCRSERKRVFSRSLSTSKGPIELWFDWFHSFSGYLNTFEVITFTESLISPKSLI